MRLSLDQAFFNSMPDTIEFLRITMIEHIDYAITLPSHLKKIKIAKTSIQKDSEIVQSFVSNLPSSIVKLSLENLLKFDGEHFKLSFGNLPHLKILEISFNESISFDSTDSPSLEQLSISPFSISDQILFALKCLDLSFCLNSTDNPTEFWQKFILPLNNLSELTLHFDMKDADLSESKFPESLCALTIFYGNYQEEEWKDCGTLKLPGIPKYLGYFSLTEARYLNFDEDSKDKTMIAISISTTPEAVHVESVRPSSD
ncbi:unnamed protein product [Ambrosiozyma monospora]|uniref:Unnamed protein product n=1 Tax=Ambrosiozyma monospora TaxID=43982 RepID=A0ACB5SZ69_AMBMO|nr:unnamed protein product [Ambrosiozyma monospora]